MTLHRQAGREGESESEGVKEQKWKEKIVRNRARDGIAVGEQRELCEASLECSFRLLQIRLKQEIAIWW